MKRFVTYIRWTFLLLLVLTVVITKVNAVLVDGNDADMYGTMAVYEQFLSEESGRGAIFQTFRLNTSYELTSVQFRIGELVGSPTGVYTSYLWTTTGTFGSTARPDTDVPIAESDSFTEGFPSTGWYQWNFSSYTLETNVVYAIGVVLEDDTGVDLDNYIGFGYSYGVEDYHEGNHGRHYGLGNGVAWTTGTYDMLFYLYGDEIITTGRLDGMISSYAILLPVIGMGTAVLFTVIFFGIAPIMFSSSTQETTDVFVKVILAEILVGILALAMGILNVMT